MDLPSVGLPCASSLGLAGIGGSRAASFALWGRTLRLMGTHSATTKRANKTHAVPLDLARGRRRDHDLLCASNKWGLGPVIFVFAP